MQLDDINSGVLPPNNVDLAGGKEEEDKLFGVAKIKRYEQNTELRRGLAIMFTLTINGWLFAVFLILLTNSSSLKLSDSVLTTLLTTTTIQVLGMMVIILWDLFPGGKDKDNPNNTN
jgi:hypothetical protein